ncbi:PA2779 family protein [Methylonatrum kenyense]|uniref:PA2779 family protein n=1 Tax=Methylonatrum kenyense TaxID=455253 RepID=UPI0020BD8E58|nr:PA2779 family protein [Methylonatrum kenyense]MCK8515122.1 PA2779 family protein [Methylonatrum kenyense]
MQTMLRRTRFLAYPFVLLFLMMGVFTQTAAAGIVGTDTVISESATAEKRAQVMSLLERDDVQERLVEYGVSPEEAKERVASMTNEELAQMAERIDEMPAGASALVLALVLVILIIILVR